MPDDVLVSVVIPVYNPGDTMDGLLASLTAQSLPQDRFEVIAVDDGSTDGAGDRLRELATTRPNLQVHTIPNSGWPGRPRNVGTDAARGRYVFYSDQDDELYPQALEKLVALADRTGADIVFGKIVRTGRHTPYWSLWHHDVDDADLVEDGLLLSRTVHKLFRRSFLVEHGLRFPEGRVRLEDHLLMAQALPVARVVSVLASYPCYHWIHRNDGSNTSSSAVDAAYYWGYYAQVQQALAERLGPGPELAAAQANAVIQAFTRFPPSGYLPRDQQSRQDLFEAVRDYVVVHAPASLDEELPVAKRLRVQALRDDDRQRFDILQELQAVLSVRVSLTSAEAVGDVLHLSATAEQLDEAGEPLPFTADGADLLLPLPDALTGHVSDADRRLLPLDHGALELTVRERSSGLEWPLECTATPVATRRPDGDVELSVQVEAVLDPQRVAFGAGLQRGTWDVLARGQFLGEGLTRRLPLPPELGLPDAVGPARLARTANDTVVVKIKRPQVHARARWEDDVLHLLLTTSAAHATLQARHRDKPHVVAASGPVLEGHALLHLPDAAAGQILDLWLVQEAESHDQRVRLAGDDELYDGPWRLYATASGWAALKRTPATATATATPGPVRKADGLLRRIRRR